MHLARRVDAAQDDGQHLRRVHGKRLDLRIGRNALDAGDRADGLRRLRPVRRRRRLAFGQRTGCHHPGIRAEREQPVPQLILEPVHHRQDHDERDHPEHDAHERRPGDEGHEELVGARPYVAQPHEQ